jgi:hypothetical protein
MWAERALMRLDNLDRIDDHLRHRQHREGDQGDNDAEENTQENCSWRRSPHHTHQRRNIVQRLKALSPFGSRRWLDVLCRRAHVR